MKKILFLTAVLCPSIVLADCWQITDNDSRYACLAQTRNNANDCWQIRDSDSKYECLALIRQDANDCWQIKDSDKRQMCMAKLK